MVAVVCGCRSTVCIGCTVPLACRTTGTFCRCGATTLTTVGGCAPAPACGLSAPFCCTPQAVAPAATTMAATSARFFFFIHSPRLPWSAALFFHSIDCAQRGSHGEALSHTAASLGWRVLRQH